MKVLPANNQTNCSVDVSSDGKKLTFYVFVKLDDMWLEMVYGAAQGWIDYHSQYPTFFNSLHMPELISTVETPS